jgi:hypothetical protein
MNARALVLATLLAVSGAPVAGQSLFNSSGLGLPVESTDARARALGNLGLGLSGGALLPTDPAAAARLVLPTGVLVAQPVWADASSGGEKNYFRGTRFPLVAAAYPILGGMVSIHFSSLLDQDFSGVREVDYSFGGAAVVATDSYEQSGTVSSMNVGYARMLGELTSVGFTVGRYTGKVDRTLARTLSTDGVEGTNVLPYVSTGSWSYGGYAVTAGAATRVVDLVNVSASATWSTSLDAEASSTTTTGDGSYDIPLQLRLGASADLAPGLTLSASVARADWSGVEGDLSSGDQARATLAFGAGLELNQARLLGRPAPLRLGFRHSDLPFSIGTSTASERIFSGGLGLVLTQTGELLLASMDLGVERGRRFGGSLTENFWRGTLSLELAGL